jgi:hypothetical protein
MGLNSSSASAADAFEEIILEARLPYFQSLNGYQENKLSIIVHNRFIRSFDIDLLIASTCKVV